MSLTIDDGPGTLSMSAELYLPTESANFTTVGSATVPVQLVLG